MSTEIIISNRENVYVNNNPRTIFQVRVNGLAKGQYTVAEHDASEEECLRAFEEHWLTDP